MSTWQQHAIPNIITNQQGNNNNNNQNLSNLSKSVEIPNGLEEINHASTLSIDFGR